MNFKHLILFLYIFILSNNYTSVAGEGMWIPSLIEKQILPEMQKAGCMLSAEDIYSVNKACLKDAVFLFGGGCSSVCISEKGLILTNYHCSEYFIQKYSTSEKDYIKDGFWSHSLQEELPISGLSVEQLISIEDVSNIVLKGVTELQSIAEKEDEINTNIRTLIQTLTDTTLPYKYTVEPFYYGNQYFLCKSIKFEDIRLVAAPPAALGSFGHNTDNWMWPRHNPDFAVYRVYTDTLNNPAKYAPSNIPLHPDYAAPISIKQVGKDDFTMVMGYPGETEEYLPSNAISYIANRRNKESITLRKIRLDIMKKYMDKDEDIYLKYYAKYANISNYYKKWIGENYGINKTNAIQKKKEEEQAFSQWVNSNDSLKNKYGSLLNNLYQIYDSTYNSTQQFWHYYEGLYSLDIVVLSRKIKKLISAIGSNDFEKEYIRLNSYLDLYYKNLSAIVEREITTALLKHHFRNYSSSVIITHIKQHSSETLSINEFVDRMYEESSFMNESDLRTLLLGLKTEHEKNKAGKAYNKLSSDPCFTFGITIFNHIVFDIYPEYTNSISLCDSIQSVYMNALIHKHEDSKIYPDANGTLRISFGKVEGYTPYDAVEYDYYTTVDGLLEKYNSRKENNDYNLPSDFVTLIDTCKSPSFFTDSKIHNCFIASNHTSGGNSGSPVFDAYGSLIGLNFDRNWHGTISDLQYDNAICRNIAVDIRFILFLLKDYGKTDYLFDELKIVNK